LTAAQKAKVKDLIDEMHTKAKKKMEDAMNAKPVNGGPNVVVAFDSSAWAPDVAPTLKAILKELTAKQSATWKELTGDPVKFDLKKIPGVQQGTWTKGMFGGGMAVPALGVAPGGPAPPPPAQTGGK